MKIFLADPHPEVRSALNLVLNHIPGVSVIGETGDIFQLLAQCAQECPDLILFDPELVRPYRFRRTPGQQLVDILTVLHRICPQAKVVAMSSRLEFEQKALVSGADGFIGKTEPPEIFGKNHQT
jgi:DNA-binding NarL/FixJ family response regulator